MGGSIFLTLFFGVFIAVGVGILGFGFHSLNLSRQAEHWPTTQGKIVFSEFDTDYDAEVDTYRALVRYEYEAGGRQITGDKIAFGYTGSSSKQFHRDIHGALPVNAEVAVRYDPANPERAVLSFGINQSIKFLLLFGGVWTMFTFGMMGMFLMSGQGATTMLENMIVYSR